MARKIIAEFDAVDGPFINKLRQIDRSINNFERGTLTAFGRVEKGVSGLLASASRLQSFTGLIAGGMGVSMATRFIDQAARIRNALREAGDASDEAFNKAFLASTRSLSGFEAFTQGVQRAQKALDNRQPLDKTIRQMETLNKLLMLGGKAGSERMSTMTQFTQALQSGKLQGDELRSLRENAPIELMRAIAKEAGGTIEQLKDLGAAGLITTDVMIRALERLEAEADRRMKNVQITMADAATVMQNGALVAVEAFDKGLGLSRTTVAGLKALGDVLGSNAETFEMFGRAAKIALGFLAVSYGGRRINEAVQGMQSYSRSLYAAAAAADAEAVAANRAVAAARARVMATTAVIDRLSMQVGKERALAAANAANQRAGVALSAALARQAAATTAVSAAQSRLLFTSRAAAASMAMLRGAFAFIGGVPGMILLVATAFLTLRDNVESAADRFERLTTDTGEARSAADALLDVQNRLNEAIKEAGWSSKESARMIVAATQEELKAKATLLALERNKLINLQQERQNEANRLGQRLAQAREELAKLEDYFARREAATGVAPNAFDTEKIADLRDEISILGDQIAEINANITLTSGQIEDYGAALRQAYSSALFDMGGLVDSTWDLTAGLREAWNNAQGVAGTNMAGAIDPAASAAERLVAWLGRAWAWVKSLAGMAPDTSAAGAGPDFENRGRMGSSPGPAGKPTPLTFDELYERDTRGGGGGGGGGRSNSDEEEALRFIEQMMTAEERRAKQMAEAIELRNRLVATYGPEHELVTQMDDAIARMNEQLQESNNLAKQFWDTMASSIASSIEDWKGWGSFVRSILADLVRQYGVDFFTALLTPGKQEGGGLGNWLGDWLTGSLHTGGSRNDRSPRTVPAAAFVGAPRFHKGMLGLKHDEFTAILQDGETVLPKGTSLGGGDTTVVMNNDFRGVDNVSRQYIEGRLSEMKKELPHRVVDAVRRAETRRRFS